MNAPIDIRPYGLDSKTVQELCKRHHATLVRAAREIFGEEDSQDADDLLQDVYLQLLDGTLVLGGTQEPARKLLAIVRGMASKRKQHNKKERWRLQPMWVEPGEDEAEDELEDVLMDKVPS